MLVQGWIEIFVFSLQDLWLRFVNFFPTIFGAFLVFLLGWIVAVFLGRGVTKLFQTLQVDKLFDQLGVMKQAHKAGLEWEASVLFGALVRWFFIIVTFLATVDILELDQLSGYISSILLYVPNIIIAALILVVAAVLASFLERLVKASMKATEVGPVKFVGATVRWSVWGFAFIAVLNQLGIASALVQVLFMGFVAMLALAGGLAFGLGGQGVAKEVWEAVRDDVKGK
ncbi:MAG: hypothetical protein A3F94_02190 [Candidatus Spechtbacteria bacterium RIFCSPLOWO2_12_FULL_38_22]|uniref:Small-conductance mechanosensitive ion channel n=1 Tax=Candidatus Spechtbacteria bacterium RIFCSPLOWO2_12_FULL_38_22 TaxID=1802165 RepID=A0A1G2HFS5_9BACT|nr:MAG: hypothetical protein A3A00_02430 [Candidatus Spechtbacteria bacterium RIFCSPLOWO2_01_FULL_38_20]OGZ59551.1 MAG: hypothetical protein A3E58_02590 [Candidatus Spechtbacteria bacterium RIFCSPHIGHO2_12_FULL_38_30]OGZ61356.1 MAG: hypothetical protein A3F94_02190 [Candidatus Spechtbacteria bacterium RIFCSPLOWO2_12_FULL_38_22]